MQQNNKSCNKITPLFLLKFINKQRQLFSYWTQKPSMIHSANMCGHVQGSFCLDIGEFGISDIMQKLHLCGKQQKQLSFRQIALRFKIKYKGVSQCSQFTRRPYPSRKHSPVPELGNHISNLLCYLFPLVHQIQNFSPF